MAEHSQRAQLALSKLAEIDAAYGYWALWCEHIDSPENDAAAWTTGTKIFYAQEFENFSLTSKVGVSAHEITHVAFRHVQRGAALYKRLMAEYDHELLNITVDAITNEMLRLAARETTRGMTLPENCIYLTDVLKKFLNIEMSGPDALSEWDTEALYMKLLRTKVSQQQQKQNGQQKQGQGQPQSGKGQSQGQQGQPQSGKGQSQGQTDDGDCDGQGGNGQQPGQGKPQQGQGNAPYDPTIGELVKEWAAKSGYEGDISIEAVKQIAHGGGADDTMEETEWAQRITRGLEQGRMAGRGIGKLGFKIADLPKSRTPWEHILRQAVTKAVTRKRSSSYQRPTRQFLARDLDARLRGLPEPVYERGWIKQKGVPRVAVCVDVSGSISDENVRVFAAEIASIGRRTGAEIHVLVFDTEVLSHTKMKGASWESEVTKLVFARGGGTDFKPVIKAASELDPSIIVVLTDLCADFGKAPAQKVVWAVEDKTSIVPPYGTVITMDV